MTLENLKHSTKETLQDEDSLCGILGVALIFLLSFLGCEGKPSTSSQSPSSPLPIARVSPSPLPLASGSPSLQCLGSPASSPSGKDNSVATSTTPLAQPITVLPQAQGEWSLKKFHSDWIRVEVRTRDQISVDQEVQRLESTTWKVVARSENPKVKSIEIESETEGNYSWMMPHPVLKSALFASRPKFEAIEEGLLAVQLPVAFADGRRSHLITGVFPEKFAIHFSAGQGETLRDETCPSLLALKHKSRALKLAFEAVNGVCPRNQYLVARALVNEAELQEWLTSLIPSGEVEVEVSFKPSRPVATEQVLLTLQAAEVAKRLQNREGATAERMSGDELRRRVRDLLVRELNALGVPSLGTGEWNEMVERLVSQLYIRTRQGCPTGEQECFFVRKRLPEPDWIEFLFLRSKTVSLTNQEFHAAVPVRDLSDRTEAFVIALEGSSDQELLEVGKESGALLQVAPGDRVEIEISRIQSFRKELAGEIFQEQDSVVDHPVCVGWGEIPTREEADPSKCLEWNEKCDLRPLCAPDGWRDLCVEWQARCCRSLSRGGESCGDLRRGDLNWPKYLDCFNVQCVQTNRVCEVPAAPDACEPGHWVKTSCKKFGTRTIALGPAPCVKTENQWTRIFRYSTPVSKIPTQEALSLIPVEDLVRGLSVRFISREEGQIRSVNRSLESLKPAAALREGHFFIRFDIPETQFSRATETLLGLTSHFTIAAQSYCGTRRDFWNGRALYHCPESGETSERPIFLTYSPQIRIAGKVRLLGARFETVEDEQ